MNEVLKNLIYFFIGSGILAFLIKSITKHFLNKDFEKYRLNLQKLVEEHKIRYSTLHEERAVVIKNLYQKLDCAVVSMQSLISPIQLSGEQTKDEKIKKAVDDANLFIRYYSENKIFFSKSTCSILDKINHELKDSFINYKTKEALEEGRSISSDASTKSLDYWSSAWQKISKDVPQVQESLADEFRKIFGVEV